MHLSYETLLPNAWWLLISQQRCQGSMMTHWFATSSMSSGKNIEFSVFFFPVLSVMVNCYIYQSNVALQAPCNHYCEALQSNHFGSLLFCSFLQYCSIDKKGFQLADAPQCCMTGKNIVVYSFHFEFVFPSRKAQVGYKIITEPQWGYRAPNILEPVKFWALCHWVGWIGLKLHLSVYSM